MQEVLSFFFYFLYFLNQYKKTSGDTVNIPAEKIIDIGIEFLKVEVQDVL
jgi:hypothetical protein